MIPVTVIGGFLGAGKTTLVNHVLRTGSRRYAVLVNDFGALNVDAGLISGQDGAVVALANGCVCCSIGPDLGGTLAQVAARRPAPEHILIEGSGVSDPWRIAQLVKLEAGVALDAVLVLVDAAAFPEQLADRYLTDTLERQIARADLVVLNKADLAPPEAAAAAVRRIRGDVRLVELAHGALPDALLGGAVPRRDGGRNGGRNGGFWAGEPEHGFRTWFWDEPGPFDRDGLVALLRGLPDSVLRVKGVCRVGPDAVPHLLQLAGRRWSLLPAPAPAPAPAGALGGPCGLVVIGTAALPEPGTLIALFRAALLRTVATGSAA